MSLVEKLKSDILPKAIKEGKFGKDKVKFVDYKPDNKFQAKDQFASSIQFGDVILQTDKGALFTQSIVIKIQHTGVDGEHACSLSLGLSYQFYNEFLFYTEILPLLGECDSEGTISKIFPKCFYASVVRGGDPANDILIFENVQKLGYKLTQSRAFIDYNHIKLTLNWIAKFHALSLVCKKKFPERFKKAASKPLEIHWTEERLKNCDAFYVENCKRGILPLQNDPSYKDKLRDILAVVEETDLSMAKIVTPVEPLAVICHGDLCRNNIFYKYNSNGVPCEVMFFDLATIRYASPIIDLSFFLFMNSSPEVRSNNWEDILRTYHSALTSNPDLNPDVTPSLEDVKETFRRHGFYGYVHSSYYLPVMLQENDVVQEWWKMNIDEHIKLRVATGGEESTKVVMRIVKHMLDQNFDFKYIKNFELKKLRKLGEANE